MSFLIFFCPSVWTLFICLRFFISSFSPTVVARDGRSTDVGSSGLGTTSIPALRAVSHWRIAAST